MDNSNNNYSGMVTSAALGEKTQVETPTNYQPSEEVIKKHAELQDKLRKNGMNHLPDLLHPNIITRNDFKGELNRAKQYIIESINASQESLKEEFDEVQKKKFDLEKRVDNDEKHLETLNKAKEETKFSSSAHISKDDIPRLFKQLEKDLQELSTNNKDEKQIQEVYTKVLSYIRNKSLEGDSDTSKECDCIKTDQAYEYIRTKFKTVSGEDKWVSVLDDQVRICKLHLQDKHKGLELDKSFGNKVEGIIKTAKELHILHFAFGHLLRFNTKDKAYTNVEFEGKIIFTAEPSFHKPNQA